MKACNKQKGAYLLIIETRSRQMRNILNFIGYVFCEMIEFGGFILTM